MTTQGTDKLGPLTSFRFFAAISVVFYHFLRGADSGFSPFSRFHLLASYGALGVAFFFILSGYILVYNYGGTLERAQRLNARSFWWKRFARIYPLFLFALIVSVPNRLLFDVQLHGVAGALIRMPVTLLANLLLVHAWYWHLNGGWNGPGWSLSAEAFFYLIFPSLLRGLASIRDRDWKAAIAKSAGLLSLAALVMCAADCGLMALGDHDARPWSGDARYFLTCNPIVNTTFFIAGMTLCLGGQRIRRQAPRASRWLNIVCGVVVLLGMADIGFNYDFPGAIRTACASIFFSALILLGGGGGPAWISRLLSWSPLLLLGEASYALYLLQFPVFHAFAQLWAAAGMRAYNPSALSNSGFYAAYIAVLIAVSILSYKCLEQPARNFLQTRQPWSWRPVEGKMREAAPVAEIANDRQISR